MRTLIQQNLAQPFKQSDLPLPGKQSGKVRDRYTYLTGSACWSPLTDCPRLTAYWLLCLTKGKC